MAEQRGPYTNSSAANASTWTAETNYVGMGPSYEYAAPSRTEDAPYNDEFGWARGLSPLDTARPMPPQDGFHGDGDRWKPYYRLRDADDALRHSVETVDGDGWDDQKGTSVGGLHRWALDPKGQPPPVNRPTAAMAPGNYQFTRPVDQKWERVNNGSHFSMADHRRNYEIMTMRPTPTTRNTYRADPPAWDQDIVDMPQGYTPVDYRVRNVEIPPSGNRNYRLG